MPVTINGDGTITGYTPPIADGSITSAKLANGAASGSKLTMPSGSIIQLVNSTLNTRGTLSITNQYLNNSSNIYYVTGIDTTVTTTQTNSKLIISASLSGEFNNRDDFFGFVLSSTIGGTTAPIDTLRASTDSKTNRPRLTAQPSICFNGTESQSTPLTTQFSNYFYAPSQASGTAITIKLGVVSHVNSSQTFYINQCAASNDTTDFEHLISHMTVMEIAA